MGVDDHRSDTNPDNPLDNNEDLTGNEGEEEHDEDVDMRDVHPHDDSDDGGEEAEGSDAEEVEVIIIHDEKGARGDAVASAAAATNHWSPHLAGFADAAKKTTTPKKPILFGEATTFGGIQSVSHNTPKPLLFDAAAADEALGGTGGASNSSGKPMGSFANTGAPGAESSASGGGGAKLFGLPSPSFPVTTTAAKTAGAAQEETSAAPTATAATAADEPETPAPTNEGVIDETSHDNDDDDDDHDGDEDGGDDDDEGSNDGKIIATPAAEAIMAAAIGAGGTTIGTAAAVRVVLTEEREEDDDDDDDIIADEVEEDMEEEEGEKEEGIKDSEGGDKGYNIDLEVDDDDDSEEEHDDPLVKAALDEARKLNKDALLSTLESKYTILQKERNDLISQLSSRDKQLSKHVAECSKLSLEVDQLKSQLHAKDESQSQLQLDIQSERNNRGEMERKLQYSQERVDRIEQESDNLRKEISRLTKSNNDYNSLLNNIQSEHSKSTGDIIPLRLQVKRLESELQSMTSHSNYLDKELASRNDDIAKMKREHSSEVRELRHELDTIRLSLEQSQRDASSARRAAERSSTELDRITKKLYDKETEFVEQKEILERDLNKERELIALKDQRVVLAEDRRKMAEREVEELKKLAKAAATETAAHVKEIQSRIDVDIENAVREVRDADQEKIEQLEQRLLLAEESRRRIEEDVLNKNTPLRRRRRIQGGEAPLAITDGADTSMLEDDGPLSLTDLYTRLAETEDDLRAEQHENKKLKILIERIHRDVAAKTPIFHQKQLELESALEELDEVKERLDYARREVTDIRADYQDLELKMQQNEREVNGLKRENVDLASQVQSLLQRRAAENGDVIAFCDIQTVQAQNQELVRQHNILREKIQELESQDSKIELDHLRSEIVTLREEREKQAKLVAGIIHQRDLYRALVVKNDASSIDTGADQLALADARADQLPLIEAKNRDLTEEVTKLRADVSSFHLQKEALEGRLKCLESINNDLTASSHRLNGDLAAAKAEAARTKIDSKHYQDRCDRLVISVEDIKSEKDAISAGKKQVEELYTQTQTNLDMARSELSKKEQAYRDAISRVNRLETDLETYKGAEHRLKTDLDSLRNENVRLGTLLTSVQRIEASLAAKTEGEIECLNEEVKRLRESKVDDDTKHAETAQRLEGKIVELELRQNDLSSQKEEAVVAATKANLEVSKLKVNIQELNLKLKTSEKELNAAKVKLGDVTIDTSAEEVLEAKVAALNTELESTKADLMTAKERLSDYHNIAKSNEEQLAELTAASKKYKEETTSTLEKLRKSESSQKEAVADLTKDLMAHRGEKDKAETELKAQIDSLTVQLTSAKEDAANAIARMDSLTSEMKRYQIDSKNAQANYDRELALHAEARSSLRDSRSELALEQSLRLNTETQLLSAKKDFEAEKASWGEAKAKLEQSVQEGKARLDDLRSQNNLLHDQMATLSAAVEKIHSEKATQASGEGHSEETNKQLYDLRELLRFKQSECTMLEADLSSAKRASERERTAADLAKKSLEEARSELKILRESSKTDDDGSKLVEVEMEEHRSKLKSAEEQLVLIRESNTTLREQSTKMAKKLKEVQSLLSIANAAATPSKEKIRNMEIEKAALEAEKESLSREAEAWKNRVNSLVSKFNQIDPTEHAEALENVEKLKGECASLKSLKEKADTENANAKGIVAKLNKEITSQKSSIEDLRAALEKSKKEKDELLKLSKASKATNKKIIEAQNAAKQAQEETKKAHEEIVSLNSRMDGFKHIMKTLKRGNEDAKVAEIKFKATEDSLQKEIANLKQKLFEAGKSSGGEAGETQAQPPSSVAATTKPGSASVDSSFSGISKLVSKVIPTKNSKAKANAAALANEEVPQADVENALLKKKGKKRKASMPQKNAAASLTEGSDVPPRKKFAVAGENEEIRKEEGKAAVSADDANADKESEVVDSTKENATASIQRKGADSDMVAGEDADAKFKADAAAKLKEELDATAIANAEAVAKAKMEEAAKRAEEEAAAKAKAEEIALKKKAKEDAIAKMKAESALRKAKEEEAARAKIEEDKKKEVAAAKLKEELDATATANAEALAKAKMEEAAKRAEEEAAAKAKVEEIALKKKAKEDAIAKMKAESALRKAKEEEAARAKIEEDKKKEVAVADAVSEKAPPEQTSTDSTQEELMKKRMLLKRKKAALEAKKKQLEAIKASAANESVAPAGTDADDSGSTSKASLPPVPEMKQSASTPITFGASTTTTNQLAFGVPKTAPMPSEPDCPKPSFFGSSTVAKPTFGSSVCGDGVKPSGETKSAEAFAFNPAAKPFASFATSTPLDARGAGGGAFLNLTPPGMSGAAPGKFVFGKSASITLTAPSVSSSVDAKPNPFASFGHTAKFGSSPFGASIGTSPFGGGESKKRSLDASEQPDAKKSHKDDDTPGDDDAAKTSSTKADDGAAKEA